VYDVRRGGRSSSFPPKTYQKFLKQPFIQTTIGAGKTFNECPSSVQMRFQRTGDDSRNYQPTLEGLLNRNVSVLIWAGDADWICNWKGNLYTADGLKYAGHDEFKSKKLVSVETSSKLDKKEEKPDEKKEQSDLMKWLKTVLSARVSSIRRSDRLVTSPAIIVDHESATFRKMMRFADPKHAGVLPKQILEINEDHPVISKLDVVRVSNPNLASEVAQQIMDNALIAAGLLDDARIIIPRMNRLMEAVLSSNAKIEAAETTESTEAPAAASPAARSNTQTSDQEKVKAARER